MFKKSLLVALLAVATSAQAADYGSSAVSVGTGGTSWNAALPTDGADFSDTFTFTLSAGTGASTRFSASFSDWAALTGNPLYGTLSLPLISFSIASADRSILATQVAGGTTGTAEAATSFSGLTAGTYTLTVKGVGVGDNADYGAYYLGSTYNITVAAVPEPESYALFLAGLGLMGAVARRRHAAKV
jgi:hypothetical protein